MTGEALRGALSLALVGAGMLFFLAGSIGLLRLPDLLTRLHALTKADNLGLGLIVLGLALQADTAFEVLRLLLVWLLTLFASAVTCYLVAHSATAPHVGPKHAARQGDPRREIADGR